MFEHSFDTSPKAKDSQNQQELQRIMSEFEKFTRFKMRFSLFLTAVVLGIYFSFLGSVAFFPNFLAMEIDQTPVTLGIVFGISAIVLGFISTGIYSFVSNSFFDPQEQYFLQKMEELGGVK